MTPAPCPFCGSSRCSTERVARYPDIPADAEPAGEWWDWFVRCASCGTEGPPRKTGPTSAVAAWNRRVDAAPSDVVG